MPFVFYTATYTDPRDERLAMDLGADAFIIKPAEPDVLLALTADVLERAEAGQLAAANALEGGEDATLKQYSEALVRKLEKKMLELERVNEELQRGISEQRRAEEALRRQVVLDELVEERAFSDGQRASHRARCHRRVGAAEHRGLHACGRRRRLPGLRGSQELASSLPMGRSGCGRSAGDAQESPRGRLLLGGEGAPAKAAPSVSALSTTSPRRRLT